MQVGGGPANSVVRGDEPSVAGHGVAPVSVAPAAAGVTLTGGPGTVDGGAASLGRVGPVVVVAGAAALSPLSLAAAAMAPITARRTTPTAAMAMMRRRRSERSA